MDAVQEDDAMLAGSLLSVQYAPLAKMIAFGDTGAVSELL